MSSPPEFDVSSLPPLREVIAAHDLRAEKKFGQNFLLDSNVTDKIARVAGDLRHVHVVEIGPGPGGLTRSLLKAGARRVSAVEFDERAVNALADLERMAEGRLQIIQGDAMAIDPVTLSEVPRAIVANLPYNIATPLLVGWLRQIHSDPATYHSMILMFQKEVAERIVARLGDKAYGRLAILTQWLCDVKKVFDLPASAFTPPPKVQSSIVQFKPRLDLADRPAFEKVERITALAFGQRRKMIRTSLKPYLGYIEQLGINPELRAENLSVEDFIALARLVEA